MNKRIGYNIVVSISLAVGIAIVLNNSISEINVALNIGKHLLIGIGCFVTVFTVSEIILYRKRLKNPQYAELHDIE